MPITKRNDTERWTFTSDSCGYMLYLDGKPQGGARTLGTATHTSDGRRRAWQHIRADIKMFHDEAQNICAQRNTLLAQREVP